LDAGKRRIGCWMVEISLKLLRAVFERSIEAQNLALGGCSVLDAGFLDAGKRKILDSRNILKITACCI